MFRTRRYEGTFVAIMLSGRPLNCAFGIKGNNSRLEMENVERKK